MWNLHWAITRFDNMEALGTSMQGTYGRESRICGGGMASYKVLVRLLAEEIVKVSKLSKTDYELLKALELPMGSKVSKPTLLVSWRKSAAGWVKLNVDGSCVGNLGPCGGGGVLRDYYGDLVAGLC
ncbi:unnamed protein product [Fraxinus pennsylvanica]|uniref:Uncharacterized protein n=1 Tax=Fraxinus pennsylvanica TaxID=56036 RepID=A0AAD2DTA1_9LAMI|nr:unnamed protein product [Fraxinus pennsylvanica]